MVIHFLVGILIFFVMVALLSFGIAIEGSVIVLSYLGQQKRVCKGGLYYRIPFLESPKTIHWSRVSFNSTTGIVEQKRYDGFCIPTTPVNHDVPPYNMYCQDEVEVTVDMRFSSRVFEPLLAVGGNAPEDLWTYVDGIFESTLYDLVRFIHSKDLMEGHSWNRFCSDLTTRANIVLTKHGIRIEDMRIQSIKLPNQLRKFKEKLFSASAKMDVVEKELEVDIIRFDKLTKAGLSIDQIIRYEFVKAISHSNKPLIIPHNPITQDILVEK